MSQTATLLGMGRKKTAKHVEQTPPADDPHKGFQINLRISEEFLLNEVDACARDEKRSRNSMLNFLIEEALRARGYMQKPNQ